MFARLLSLAGVPLIVTVRVPCWKQFASANSQSAPVVGSVVEQAASFPPGPWVVAFAHDTVLLATVHGPSPVAFLPSTPPLHVWKTCVSTYPNCENGSWLLTELQLS